MLYVTLTLLASQTALIVLLVRQQHHALEVMESVARSGSPDLRGLVECIDRLCQRVQAPEYAIAEHAQAAMPQQAPQAVSMFDDDDHWASKEELADLTDKVTNGATA